VGLSARMSEHVVYASSAAATEIRSNEGTRMPFMRACELGCLLWVTFLGRARKVTRPSVREPTAFDFDLRLLALLILNYYSKASPYSINNLTQNKPGTNKKAQYW